jgi:hypothetical protein
MFFCIKVNWVFGCNFITFTTNLKPILFLYILFLNMCKKQNIILAVLILTISCKPNMDKYKTQNDLYEKFVVR